MQNYTDPLNEFDYIVFSVCISVSTKVIGTVIEIDKSASILPAHFNEKIINGQKASVVHFDRESPLMEIAHQRNQI